MLKAFIGEALHRESAGLWNYKARRFRIAYEIDRKTRVIQILAIGHRREAYEELAEIFRTSRLLRGVVPSATEQK